MPVLFRDKLNAFNVFKSNGSSFDNVFQIVYEDILDGTTITINEDKFELELKIKRREPYTQLFNSDDLWVLERTISDKTGGNGVVTFVLLNSTFTFSDGKAAIILKAYGLTFFESMKKIGTTENVIITDPDATVPENFYKYRDSGNIFDVLNELYDNVLINPQILANGALLGVDNDRLIKNVGSLLPVLGTGIIADVSFSADTNLLDAKKSIFELFNQKYRWFFEINALGLLDVKSRLGNFIDLDLISNPDDVKSFSYKVTKNENFTNYYNGRGSLSLYANETNIRANELTSVEVSEDISQDSGNNQGYLDNVADSKLKLMNNPVVFDIELKLKELTQFIDYNLSDVINVSGFFEINGKYRIIEITENISVSGVTALVRLEKK